MYQLANKGEFIVPTSVTAHYAEVLGPGRCSSALETSKILAGDGVQIVSGHNVLQEALQKYKTFLSEAVRDTNIH